MNKSSKSPSSKCQSPTVADPKATSPQQVAIPVKANRTKPETGASETKDALNRVFNEIMGI